MAEVESVSGVLRVIRSVSIGALLFAVVGVLFMMLGVDRSTAPPTVAFSSGYGPGVVLLMGRDEAGLDPFTAPVAVDLDLDFALAPYPPLNADVFLSAHTRSSAADQLVADGFGWELTRRTRQEAAIPVAVVEELAGTVLGGDGRVADLEDRNGDGRDDDGRFTVVATDGSAVCVTIGPTRMLPAALGAAVDPEDGTAVGGIDWDPTGPCTDVVPPSVGRQIRTGSTPGIYGGLSSGDVCDVGLLLERLQAVPVVAEGWALVHGIAPVSLPEYISTLTPVVLLRDTLVTDFGWQNGRLIPRQAVLERGSEVLVGVRGTPVVRCVSGSPLRSPVGLPANPAFQGPGWDGFDRDLIDEIPPSDGDLTALLLLDLVDGSVISRSVGTDGASGELAGPIRSAASEQSGGVVQQEPSPAHGSG